MQCIVEFFEQFGALMILGRHHLAYFKVVANQIKPNWRIIIISIEYIFFYTKLYSVGVRSTGPILLCLIFVVNHLTL